MTREVKFAIKDLNFYYDDVQALKQINLEIYAHAINVIFGPARGGKSTLLRLLNRLNDLCYNTRMMGKILLDGEDIYAPGVDVIHLRCRVGMVFARPIPLPDTIRNNILYGPRLNGVNDGVKLDGLLERTLRQVALWSEVKDRLDEPAAALSGGQQQRLCIARVLALEPEVVLLDEPCSGLDPISTARVEGSLRRLKRDYTIVLVPHSIQQAARVADYAAFFLMGELIEHGAGEQIFTNPRDKRTNDYITGRFG